MRPVSSIAVGTDAVRAIVPSLDGREAVVSLGDKRSWVSPHVSALLRIEGDELTLGAAPGFAEKTMFALGDGEVAAAQTTHNKLTLLRRNGTTELFLGASIGPVWVLLAPDGRTFRVRVIDRDDGHGWTDPVYSYHALSFALDGSGRAEIEPFRALRGAGSPALATHDGGDGAALDRLIHGIPWGYRVSVCVGPRLLLTKAEVIDVRTGETLIGERSDASGPRRVFFDLSADERRAVAADADGTLELWDVAGRTVDRIALGETRCAAFVPGDRLLVGGADGRVHLLR
jgi:hypothetical protein